MEEKYDRVFDEVVAACEAKHLKEIMAFTKNWNDEIIAQFFATFEKPSDQFLGLIVLSH
jgi:hypothetical protein